MSVEIPKVEVLSSFSPATPDAATLRYSNLAAEVARQRPFEPARLTQAWENSDPVIAELHASEAASQYLLMTAQRLQEVPSGERAHLWSDRFTQASMELFGAPESTVAAPLLASQYDELCGSPSDRVDRELLAFVSDVYRNALADVGAEMVDADIEKAERIREAAEKIKEVIMARFGDVMAIFDGDDNQLLTAASIADKFDAALVLLKERDPRWGGWVVDRTQGAGLISRGYEKKIVVGQKRVSSTQREVRGLFAHEVLLHSLSAVNAADEQLCRGLPGYQIAEEGEGVFFEFATTYIVPPKIIDRYGDIALALGTLNRRPMPRKNLFDFVVARGIIREQAAGNFGCVDTIVGKAREHTNRIYRGSRGDEHIGVFTKDIAYYLGFLKIADFVLAEFAAGRSADDIFDILTVGKFDPTNAQHVAYEKAARERRISLNLL